MTRQRKWVLRIGLFAVLALAAAGTWAGTHLTELKAMVAARQLRGAGSEEERAKAADQLAALGEPGVSRLMGFARANDEAGHAAMAALERFLGNLADGDPHAVTVAGQLLDVFPGCDGDGQRAILGMLPVVLKKTGNAHASRCRAAIAAGLKMPDAGARVLAIRLSLHPDVRMQAELMPLLTAPEAEVRRAALFALASITDGDHMIGDEELFHWLHDPDDGVRKVCHDALVQRDRSEVEIGLGRRLTDPDPLERLKLLLDLRYDDDVADPEPWLERLSRDPEPAVRASAARVAVEVTASRRQSCPRWVARVADADTDATVRRVAAFFYHLATSQPDPRVRPAGMP